MQNFILQNAKLYTNVSVNFVVILTASASISLQQSVIFCWKGVCPTFGAREHWSVPHGKWDRTGRKFHIGKFQMTPIGTYQLQLVNIKVKLIYIQESTSKNGRLRVSSTNNVAPSNNSEHTSMNWSTSVITSACHLRKIPYVSSTGKDSNNLYRCSG